MDNGGEKQVHNVHMLTQQDSSNEEAHNPTLAKAICERTIEAVKHEPNAYLSTEALNAFREIRVNDSIEYERLRTLLKLANGHIRIGILDKLTRPRGEEPSRSQSAELTDLASEYCEFWHDADLVPYATFERIIDGRAHKEHWPIDSNGFQEWLAWLAHTQLGSTPSSEVIKSTCNILSGCCKFDGKQYPVYKRVAHYEGEYWLDLCNEKWCAIRITPNGYSIVESPTVKFIRSKTMRPLVMPLPGGDMSELWELVNLPEEDRIFVLAFMLEAFRENTPYVVLELIGEQGSAKSTTQRIIREFIDPNRVPLRATPKNREDIFIASANGHVISYENLSGLSPEFSDAFCTICTGGGLATRAHYKNKEESVIESRNPIILNGIGAIITRPDLLDRAIVVNLPVIEERKTETTLTLMLDKAAPRIMGALLDLFVGTLSKLPNVEIPAEELPRMADFTQLGEAMSLHLGYPAGEFLQKYRLHRQDAIRRTIDASPVATACMLFVEKGGKHYGTVKSLYGKLRDVMDTSQLEKTDYWPKNERGLGSALRRIAPALRQIGIECRIESKSRRDGFHCVLKGIPAEIVEHTL